MFNKGMSNEFEKGNTQQKYTTEKKPNGQYK